MSRGRSMRLPISCAQPSFSTPAIHAATSNFQRQIIIIVALDQFTVTSVPWLQLLLNIVGGSDSSVLDVLWHPTLTSIVRLIGVQLLIKTRYLIVVKLKCGAMAKYPMKMDVGCWWRNLKLFITKNLHFMLLNIKYYITKLSIYAISIVIVGN